MLIPIFFLEEFLLRWQINLVQRRNPKMEDLRRNLLINLKNYRVFQLWRVRNCKDELKTGFLNKKNCFFVNYFFSEENFEVIPLHSAGRNFLDNITENNFIKLFLEKEVQVPENYLCEIGGEFFAPAPLF